MQHLRPGRLSTLNNIQSIPNRLLDILTAFISERVNLATHDHNATESAVGKLDPLIPCDIRRAYSRHLPFNLFDIPIVSGVAVIMRLLQITTLRLEEFFASSAIDERLENQGIPKYAILSHTC